MSTADVSGLGTFARLRHTFYTCFTFATIAGFVSIFEVVLTARDGGAFALCARLAAGFGVAASFAAIVAAFASPYLHRFEDLRTTRRSIANAIALGTIVAVPVLINKLAR